jgi:hypothetical protein
VWNWIHRVHPKVQYNTCRVYIWKGRTAVVMEELGANSKRLPEWLITPNTMQKCDFSPENKQKLRPDCMIVEIRHEEIDRTLKKRTRNGDNKVPTQINGRPRKIWLMELGYS